MSAITSLLDSLVDYAGLFPPAKLPMGEAVRNHARYLAGPQRTMLGRFVLPLAQLADFEAAHAALPPTEQHGWRLSVLADTDPAADAGVIAAFNSRQPHARIVSIETKANNPAEVARLTAPFPRETEVWVELPAASPELPTLIAAVGAAGRGAKLRTGGVTPEAFPSPEHVVRFLRECHRAGVVLKATAGLHHPLRGDYHLTYEPGSPQGRMFGFLNLFLAATLLHTGGSAADALALLDDRDADHFSCTPDALAWRQHRFTAAQLADTRRSLCRSFGSCSFTEPIEGLQQLHWL